MKRFIIDVADDYDATVEDVMEMFTSGQMGIVHTARCHKNALPTYEDAELCVIAIGNPVDGITLYGPFDDGEAANVWAENEGGDWWNITITNPKERA